MADPTPDDVTGLAEIVGQTLREHQPTTGMAVTSGVTCRCGYWSGVEEPGRTRPVGYPGLQWHQTMEIAGVLAARDARVRAETLQEAASQAEWEFRRMSFNRGDGCTSTTELHPVGAWLRERADAVERGESL